MREQIPASSDTPPGAVIRTLLLADLVNSTTLVAALGDERSTKLWQHHDRLARGILDDFSGIEIDKADGFLLLFERPIDATLYALTYHVRLAELSKSLNLPIAARVGIHVGEVFLRKNDAADVARGAKRTEVFGLAVQTTARIMSLAQGGQSLLSRIAFELARRAAVGDDSIEPDICWLDHGTYRVKGIEEPVTVCEVGSRATSQLTPPPDSEKAWRTVPPEAEVTLGWRPAVGQAVPGNQVWKLVRKLGGGGFGEVWLARHKRGAEQRAFKFWFNAEWLRSSRRELALCRWLQGKLGTRKDIIRLHNHQFDRPPYYLEMEYLAGGSLTDWAAAAGGIENVDIATRLELIAQIADALEAVHSAGVVHRDVKPMNVLVRFRSDETPQICLSDFGVGRLLSDDAEAHVASEARGHRGETHSADPGRRSGSRLYVPPENLVDDAPASAQGDVYALGVLLYQMVVGDFNRPVAHGWERDVDDELLCRDIADCIAGVPERRLASAGLLADRLRSLDRRRAEDRDCAERRRRRERRWRSMKTATAAALGVLLIRGALTMEAQRLRMAHGQANNIMAMLCHDPSAAVGILDRVPDSVRTFYSQEALQHLSSSSHNDRVMGVRAALWADPLTQLTFWSFVNSGKLWDNGEWLELCALDWSDPAPLFRQLKAKAVGGSVREKYVAFCLIGALGGDRDELARLCARAVQTETHAGVVSAARWAASRLGRHVPYRTNKHVFVDDMSGIVFARIPGTEAFRPGSPPGEAGRSNDEDRPRQGVRIDPMWISITEVTWAQFESFAPPASQEASPGRTDDAWTSLWRFRAEEAASHDNTPVRNVSPVLARAICARLNQRARDHGIAALYRLPTEEEWEYACRAGNAGAFCYGDRPEYLEHFATRAKPGEAESLEVATKMPNFFGLFDMHGNVWEICDTSYRTRYEDPQPRPVTAEADWTVVRRGGSLHEPASFLRSARRDQVEPTVTAPYAGFRIVLERRPTYSAIQSAGDVTAVRDASPAVGTWSGGEPDTDPGLPGHRDRPRFTPEK